MKGSYKSMAGQTKVPELRLLKVVVQPVVVIDDGVNLQEYAVDPITVNPTEWASYPAGRFQEQLKELQDQLAESVKAQAEKQAKK
jgi:hypothetical protein